MWAALKTPTFPRHAEDDGNRRLSSTLRCMEEFEHREKPAITKEERAAKKKKSFWDAQKALAERKKAEDSFRANYERLKAERLAREAAKHSVTLRADI